MMDDAPPVAASRPCPICGKPAIRKFSPFCSERCSLVDLGRWLGEGYRVPTSESPEEAPVKPGPDGSGEGQEDGGAE
jgi:endogenous inhibitor of DNA gyrase (YacG/DUF329 family)